MSVETVECRLLVGELLEMEEVFEDVFDRVIKDGPTTFAFALLLGDIRKHIKAFNTARTTLAKSLGTDKGDGTVFLPEDKAKQYNAELLSMLEEGIVLQVPKLTEEDFGQIQPPVAPIKLARVMPLFKYLTDSDQK